MKTIVEIIIKGKVQGVWYRKSTKAKADQLSIVGTVQNLPNGDVKAIAMGDKESLEHLIVWAKQGPQHAEVQSVNITTIQEPLHFDSFEIIR